MKSARPKDKACSFLFGCCYSHHTPATGLPISDISFQSPISSLDQPYYAPKRGVAHPPKRSECQLCRVISPSFSMLKLPIFFNTRATNIQIHTCASTLTIHKKTFVAISFWKWPSGHSKALWSQFWQLACIFKQKKVKMIYLHTFLECVVMNKTVI